jgi:hypothetical protein
MREYLSAIVFVVLSIAAVGGFIHYPQLKGSVPALPFTQFARPEVSVVHELPDGTQVRVFRFQNRILEYSTGLIDTYDVDVVPLSNVDDQARLVDEVFDDLMSVEADRLAMNSATVSLRSPKDASGAYLEETFLYLRDSEFVWTRNGTVAPADNTRKFNLQSPKTFALSNGDVLEIEGERVRHHVRANGAIMFEAALHWPQANWQAVPFDRRRQKGHDLARRYWLERGKAIADQHGAKMGLFRLYTAPFQSRSVGRQHLWTGVIKKEFGWEEIPFSAEDAQKIQNRLLNPEALSAGWLKLADGESVQLEGVYETGFTEGTYRKGIALTYRSNMPLDDTAKLDAHAQQIFDHVLKKTCIHARVRSCMVQAKSRTGLWIFSWDTTHDVMFDMVDGDWRMAKKD